MNITCQACGIAIKDAQKPNRRWCSDRCRKRAGRAGIAGTTAPLAPPAAPLRAVTGLLDAVVAELAAADRTNTVAGQLALELARRIADSPPMNTGVAGISKQLQAVMAQALAGAAAPKDRVDQLKLRRDRKRSAART